MGGRLNQFRHDPDVGSTQHQIHTVGKPLVKKMILCGEVINALAALPAGLVAEVVEDADISFA